MATHSSILAGEIPWTEEPGGLQRVGLQSWAGLSVPTHMPRFTYMWGAQSPSHV